MGSLLERVKSDIQRITSNSNEFGVTLTFTAPDASTAVIAGLHSKHHAGIDTDGNLVNSKKAHISFSEALLTALNYPVRNNKGVVDFKGHKVIVADSTGNTPTYLIREWLPDETVGLIVCFLGDFDNG